MSPWEPLPVLYVDTGYGRAEWTTEPRLLEATSTRRSLEAVPRSATRHRAYAERRTKDGLSKPEIMRCVKRYLAREVYHALVADFEALTGDMTIYTSIPGFLEAQACPWLRS